MQLDKIKSYEMDNLYNSLFDIKEVYKLLYDISKALNLLIAYENIKLICYNFKKPVSEEETLIYAWLKVFYLCYSNRAYIHDEYKTNDYIKIFQELDNQNYINMTFEMLKHKTIVDKGVLLIILSILISKREGIIFRYFSFVFKNFEEEDQKYITDYLKGFLETFKVSAPKRKKLSQVLEVLHDNIDFFKKEKVKSLSLFGSVVKGSNTYKSDIDLLVYFDDIPAFEKEIHSRTIASHLCGILQCGCDIVEEAEVLYDSVTDALKTAIKIF